MKVLVLGCEGQLGRELLNLYGPDAIGCGKSQVDISSIESIERQLEASKLDCVINAAAYNKVDQAEDDPEVAYLVNALGPRHLAVACAARNLPLVHISTDYVFGIHSNERPWTVQDAPGPVSAYGVSKLAGEYFVRSLCSQHFVLRTCGLYGKAAIAGRGKGNFVETMLQLGSQRDELRIVDDQHCTPTSAKDLALAIQELVPTCAYGLYHATNGGECTWATFAEEIFRYSDMNTRVIKIPGHEYPTKSKRPSYSVLNCDKLESAIGRPLRTWESALHDYLDDRTPAERGK